MAAAGGPAGACGACGRKGPALEPEDPLHRVLVKAQEPGHGAKAEGGQRFVLPPLRTTQRIKLMAPTIRRRRMSVWPILLTEPSLVLPPVDHCRGTRPSHAAKFRPLSNVSRSGANAETAPVVTGPIPGMVHNLRSCASVFDAALSSSASCSITLVSRAIWPR